ncbi:MAG: acetolactate synthase small subunit [Lachnospiraceae bacterium]|jgi:acetolactate synthase-1/3 small subunit|nr:acetolactate synthase small subunit [Lachnospiraceae bacterium]MBQ2040570.1 acetolactate synthase small subunit [Lachnospiraceae bacterium]
MLNNRNDVSTAETRRTLSVLVDNKPGVLSQIARLFTRNGYNIESFTAGTTIDEDITRLTIEVTADDSHTELMVAQLSKMVPVHSVKLLEAEHVIRRELVLFKVHAVTSEVRNEIIQVANIFRGSVIDVSRETLTLSIIGDEKKIDGVRDILEGFGIIELARTGMIALERGKYTINDESKVKGEFNYGKNVL